MVAETVPKRGCLKIQKQWGPAVIIVLKFFIISVVAVSCPSSWNDSESPFPTAADVSAARWAQSRAQDRFVQLSSYAADHRPTLITPTYAALRVTQSLIAVPPSLYAVGTDVIDRHHVGPPEHDLETDPTRALTKWHNTWRKRPYPVFGFSRFGWYQTYEEVLRTSSP